MTSPFHNALLKKLAALNSVPEDPSDLDAWLECSGQLSVIDGQAADDEIILYAVGVRTFVHSVGVSSEQLAGADPTNFLEWSGNAYAPGTIINWD